MAEAIRTKWYHSIGFVLFMLFAVLGPFGFPLLWKSPRFNRAAKWALTVIVCIYTVWLVQLSLTAARAVMEHLQQLQPVLY